MITHWELRTRSRTEKMAILLTPLDGVDSGEMISRWYVLLYQILLRLIQFYLITFQYLSRRVLLQRRWRVCTYTWSILILTLQLLVRGVISARRCCLVIYVRQIIDIFLMYWQLEEVTLSVERRDGNYQSEPIFFFVRKTEGLTFYPANLLLPVAKCCTKKRVIKLLINNLSVAIFMVDRYRIAFDRDAETIFVLLSSQLSRQCFGILCGTVDEEKKMVLPGVPQGLKTN